MEQTSNRVLAVVLTVGVSLLWGCADDETPTAPPRHVPEFTATIDIDSCEASPPGQPLDGLCGNSSDIRGSFDFAYAGVKEEYAGAGYVTRVVTLKTGPGTWVFSRHGCTRQDCGLGDALDDLFEGRPLTILARRSTSVNDTATVLSAYLVAGTPATVYALSLITGPIELPLDAAGFPVIDGDVAFAGSISIGTRFGTAVGGSIDVTIKNWDMLPVHHKPEPPVVARPAFAAQELQHAPEIIQLGEYTLAFDESSAFRPPPDGGLTVEFSIWEQGLWDFDQARLDFLWVVHESGEVWEPEIASAWDTFHMVRSVRDGPQWEVGTDVDVVVGFVDLEGGVWLMRTTDTIE